MGTRTQDRIAKKNIKESHNISFSGTPTVGFGFVYASFSQTSTETVASGRFGNDGATVNDSFNNTSLTDDGTGQYTATIANDFNNTSSSIHY